MGVELLAIEKSRASLDQNNINNVKGLCCMHYIAVWLFIRYATRVQL